MKKYNWEKEFDHRFVQYDMVIDYWGTIKSFIRQLLAQEEANWMAEIHEQLKDKHKDGYQMGYSAGIAMASQTELKIRQEERERIKKLIIDEMTICDKEGTPTSRLTSLYNKII